MYDGIIMRHLAHQPAPHPVHCRNRVFVQRYLDAGLFRHHGVAFLSLAARSYLNVDIQCSERVAERRHRPGRAAMTCMQGVDGVENFH